MDDSVIKLLTALIPIAREVVQGVASDDSNEEILNRIAAPGGVGENLINAARVRKGKIKDFIDNG